MKQKNPLEKRKGLLITLEGGEGGGKTTQSYLLRTKLIEAGHDVVVLREPGGTQISEQIREVVLNKHNSAMAYTTEVLLFQAARAQIYREIVIPSLEANKTVLMDRSRDSSVVYQGMVRGFGKKMIEQLNDISTNQTLPDITILLDLPAEIGLDRRGKTEKMDRLDMEKIEFHQKVRQAYLELAKEDESGRWVVIDAGQPIEKVAAAIWQAVSAKFKKL